MRNRNSIHLIRLPIAIVLLIAHSIPLDAQSTWTPVPLEQLTPLGDLPPLLIQSNGTPVTSVADWERRRNDIKAMIQYYQYGHLPPRPDRVEATNVTETAYRDNAGRVRRLTLRIDSHDQLAMDVAVYLPSSDGPHPVIVAEAHAIGDLPCIPMWLEHNFAFVQYEREDLAPDKSSAIGPAQQAYANYDWATLAVWAWGAMRVVDYLETCPEIRCDQIAVTGHSRGGKAALLAGALDERFALVAPNGSGCGGAGCFRDNSSKNETLALITDPQRFHYWFHPRLREFAGREERLPFDQHFVKALVAPRALLCTEARGDLWANPAGTRRTSVAAREVYQLYGAADKIGLCYREGQHDQTLDDWRRLLEFAEWHFRGTSPQRPQVFWDEP
jgi:hypothetical protein